MQISRPKVLKISLLPLLAIAWLGHGMLAPAGEFENAVSRTSTQESALPRPPADTTDFIKTVMLDLNGDTVKWSQFAGKAVFLNMFQTLNKFSRTELPSIERAKRTMKGKMVFLLLSDEPMEVLKTFRDEHPGFTVTYLHTPVRLKNLGVPSIPSTYVYDANALLVFQVNIGQDWGQPQMMNKLNLALSQ